MVTASDVESELMGTNPPPGHHDLVVHKGGPKDLQKVVRTVQAKVTYCADEITRWLPFRALSDLRKRRRGEVNNGHDTTLGHAVNAASASLMALEIALRIAKRLDIDVSDVEGLDSI